MIGTAIIAVISAWLLGTACVAGLWPRNRPLAGDLPLIVPLGLGAGLGITSALFFAASLGSAKPLPIAATFELCLIAAAGCGGWLRRRKLQFHLPDGHRGVENVWIPAVLGTLFAQSCIIALVTTTRAYQAEPYSNSDGWTIWLMHARFLFRGGEDWPALLHAPQIAWTHPDYPLLVPASFARAWAHAGQDAPYVSGLISTLFGAATVALLVAAVARMRDGRSAWLGGLLLLGTPFFITFSSNQHADIPLGFYILATLVLIALGRSEPRGRGFSILAGATAAMAAWTKNEGIMFAAVAGCAWGAYEVTRGSHRKIAAFLAGLAVALLPLLYFKFVLAPSNDIVASQPWDRWPDLIDPSRHQLILSSLARDIMHFGQWSLVPFVAMLLPLFGGRWKQLAPHEWLVAVVLGLMLLGFYSVYLLTHWDLKSHLDSSLVRVLLQLWPAALFFWCLALPYDSSGAVTTAARSTPKRHRAKAAILLGNVALGLAVLAILARQPARNELAAGSIPGGRITVLMGEGWFGRESHGHDVWAWSKGEAALLLRMENGRPTNTTLRFSIRSLGTRTVTAESGGRVIWRAVVDEEAQEVTISGLLIQPGTTTIVFRSDAPGVIESSAEEARALTYALYNPVVE